MDEHVSDVLMEYVLGDCTDAVRLHVEQHLAVCSACVKEWSELYDMIGLLAAFSPPQRPPKNIRDQVLSECSGVKRFLPRAQRVAQLLELSERAVLHWFERLEQAQYWTPGPAEGTSLILLPTPSQDDVKGFIRLEPNALFPMHDHLGKEHLLVLVGAYTDDSGRSFHPGEEDVHAASTQHAIRAMEWIPCICAFRLETGFQFVGKKA